MVASIRAGRSNDLARQVDLVGTHGRHKALGQVVLAYSYNARRWYTQSTVRTWSTACPRRSGFGTSATRPFGSLDRLLKGAGYQA